MNENRESREKSITRKKASQWLFTIPSFNTATIDHLSKLPPKDVTYITFAISNDDTGNRHLLGFVKTSHRCRISMLIKLMGYAIFSVVPTYNDVKKLLVEIQMKPGFLEFGNSSFSNHSGYRSDIFSFKEAAKAGLSADQLKKKHPNIFVNYPALVYSYLHGRARSESETSESSGDRSKRHVDRLKKIEDQVKKEAVLYSMK